MAIVKEVIISGTFANAANTMSKDISCILFGVAAFALKLIKNQVQNVKMEVAKSLDKNTSKIKKRSCWYCFIDERYIR